MVCVVVSDAVSDASVSLVVVVMIVVLLLVVSVLGSAVIARPSVAHCFVRERQQKNCKLCSRNLRDSEYETSAKTTIASLQNALHGHCRTHAETIANPC